MTTRNHHLAAVPELPTDEDKRRALRRCWSALDDLDAIEDELAEVIDVDLLEPVAMKLAETADAVRALIGRLTQEET